MAHEGLTRRTLIAALAGAGAAGLLRPPLGEAAPASVPAPRRSDQWLGRLSPGTTSVVPPQRVDLVGVQWDGPADAQIGLRARVGGAWGAWAQASGSGHEPDAVDGGPRIGDPLWLGGADELQLRAPATVQGVRLHFVDVSAGRGAAASVRAVARGASLRPAAPVLQAGPGQPAIIDREAWALGRCPPSGPPEYGDVSLAFVHHTENPNGYSAGEVPAMLRAIFVFHRYVRGWRDIGYNFVIDRFGRAFEARTGGIDEPVLGAHAGGYNAASTGVAVLGDFVSAPISPAALEALQRLVAWKLSLHGRPILGSTVVHVSPAGAVFSRFPARAAVRLPRVAGHRDADSTSCPGDALYRRLPAIRAAAHALAGPVVRSTLATPLAQPLAPGTVELQGALRYLDGSPLPGATILLQARRRATDPPGPREAVLAQVTSEADGTWSASLPLAYNVSLRALHVQTSGVPAAVSDPLDLLVAPTLTLGASPAAPAVGQPVALTGTVAPARAHVEIDVWRVGGGGRRVGPRRLRVSARGGAFASSFTPSATGTYRCQAVTAADTLNAAGRSAMLILAVGAPAPVGP